MSTTRWVAWSIAAACAGVIAATAGCGSTHDTPSATPTSRRTVQPAHTAPTETLVSKDQLRRALPGRNDIPGLPMTAHDMMLLTHDDLVTATPATCQLVADTMSYDTKYPRLAQVWATASGDTTAPAPDLITLTSHTRHDATAWVDDLTTTLGHCHHFTASSSTGWLKHFTVRPLPAPHAGDASAAYFLGDDEEPLRGTAITVVRTGSILAFYQAVEDITHPQAVTDDLATLVHHRIQRTLHMA